MVLEYIEVNEKRYTILKLLGKGKGGYSYLVSFENKFYVCKQIHHEPCSYYTFGNKLESELKDYETLKNIGICMPKLLSVDYKNERIVKEYIDGPTIYELILKGCMKEEYRTQLKEMCNLLYPAGLNIDYFPTNFVVQNHQIYYIDYECNSYMEQWNYENWGIKYWYKTKEFIEYSTKKEKEV